ncbi:MAG: flagellar motor switch protein FliG [Planctomycetota bacterium]
MKLRGPEKIAALLLALDRKVAALLLRNLGEKEIALVGRAMASLQNVTLDEEVVAGLLSEFRKRLGSAAPGRLTSRQIDTLFNEALGDKGKAALDELHQSAMSSKPFAPLEDLPAEDIVAMLRDEHPQVIALVLSYLSPETTAGVIAELPANQQVDVLSRMATRDTTSPELLNQLTQMVADRVASGGVRYVASSGAPLLKNAAEVLNRIDAEMEKDILEGLRNENPELADSIEEHRFGFGDLVHIEKRSMQKVLSTIDTRSLALALKAAEPEVEEHILSNMSKRSRAIVLEEREVLGPVPLSEVLEAQKAILATVRSLRDAGEIKLSRGSDDELVS